MVFIIAELGVNWRDLVDADDMIREAAKAGADAVKFQCYKPEFKSIKIFDYTCGMPPKENPGTYHFRAEELNRIALDESTIRYLYWRCQQHGIEFMCTPMYPEAVVMLDPYVKRWKVRYADQENEDILTPCRATGKQMLISGKNLFCIPEYPPDDMDYTKLKGLDGFSSHFPNTVVMETAILIHNLPYLEVHVRLDKYEPHYCPIDTAVSITMSELAELCRRLKE